MPTKSYLSYINRNGGISVHVHFVRARENFARQTADKRELTVATVCIVRAANNIMPTYVKKGQATVEFLNGARTQALRGKLVIALTQNNSIKRLLQKLNGGPNR